MERIPLRNVTTHQLEYLIMVSRSETMADAARQLNISASALSQGLSELERRLGLGLFERQGRNRVLNAAGDQAVEHAERILTATRDMTNWVDASLKGEQGRVRLGLIDIAAVNYFPETLIDYRRDRPEIELQLSVAPSSPLIAQVLGGQLDAAVIVEPGTSADPDLVFGELFTEELAIYAPGLVGGQADQPPGVVGDPSTWGPWVTFPVESHTRRHIARALRDLGAEFRVEAESHQPEVLRQMVNLGMGWTVLPVLQAETEPNPLVRARKAPLLRRRLVLVRRKATAPTAATSELIDRITAKAATVNAD